MVRVIYSNVGVFVKAAHRAWALPPWFHGTAPPPKRRGSPHLLREFLLGTKALAVQGRSGDQVVLALWTASGDRRLEASDLLVATGRVPNTAGIGLEAAGIETDARGYVRVNDRLETCFGASVRVFQK
jgi:pyruvate/2-oxoglutarate dehydrogenase complex dihydrolipoamide dehydrogenase (E3) component